MSELKNGTVGLLWENGGGSIRYDNYDIAQLAADGYINDLELGVELTRNETIQGLTRWQKNIKQVLRRKQIKRLQM